MRVLPQVVTEEKIQQAKKWCTSHMTQPGVEGSGEAAFNEPGWRYILETHGVTHDSSTTVERAARNLEAPDKKPADKRERGWGGGIGC